MNTRGPAAGRREETPNGWDGRDIHHDSFVHPGGPYRPGSTPPSKECVPVLPREQCVYLDKIAAVVIPQAEMPLAELKEREDLRLSLVKICIQVIEDAAKERAGSGPSIHVSLNCFGSLKAGIALQGADLDLILKVTDETNRDLIWELDIPRRLERMLLVKGYGARLLTTPRVPVLKTCSEPGKELRDSLLEELDWWQSSQPKLPDPKITVQSLQRPDARLDKLFSVAMRDGHFNRDERDVIRRFQSCYKKARGVSTNPELCAARLALMDLPRILDRYPDRKSNHLADFPTAGVGINCDIGFSGDLARHNSQLIRCYARCDERLRGMIIFVKAWAKKRGINSPFRGTLCSYGYVLMVLHFAIKVASPPLCPNLQHQVGPLRGGADGVPKDCEGYNIQFWRDEKEVELAAMRGMLTYNDQTLGSLLRGFFAYYADNALIRKRFRWDLDTISIRSAEGLITKKAKAWTSFRSTTVPSVVPNQPPRIIPSNYLLAIEDPFEIDHNVARTVTRFGVEAIREEFRRAHKIIQHAGLLGETEVDLMERQ